jgi:hypothetical protein
MRKTDLIKDPTLWAIIGIVAMLAILITGN